MFGGGSGTLYGFPNAGNLATNPTPTKFGTLQDVTIDISGDTKQLYGQKQFPELVARFKCKISGKAKFARINGKQLNDIFFAQTVAAGMISAQEDSRTFATSVVIAPPSGTYLNDTARGDQGCIYAATGIPLAKVASAPAVGQYSVVVSTGTYTFNVADTGSVLISYLYTPVSTGVQVNVSNQLMGFAPTFQVLLTINLNGVQCNLLLYACVASKLTFNTKQDDFIVPELDFEAFANPAGKVLDIYSAE